MPPLFRCQACLESSLSVTRRITVTWLRDDRHLGLHRAWPLALFFVIKVVAAIVANMWAIDRSVAWSTPSSTRNQWHKTRSSPISTSRTRLKRENSTILFSSLKHLSHNIVDQKKGITGQIGTFCFNVSKFDISYDGFYWNCSGL